MGRALWADETLWQRQGSECVVRNTAGEFLEGRGKGGECRVMAGGAAGQTEEDLEGSSQGLGLVLHGLTGVWRGGQTPLGRPAQRECRSGAVSQGMRNGTHAS